MCNNIFRVILLSLMSVFVVCAQSTTRRDTVFVFTRCPPESVPQVNVDSLILIDAASVDVAPQPTNGLIGIQQLAEYPELAWRAKLQGKASIQATVDKQGNAADVRVQRSDYETFEDPCIAAVRGTIFRPGQLHGHPVESKISVLFSFSFQKKYTASEQERPPNLSEISLRHGPGMIAGPTYTVVLRKDGSAEYVGESHVDRLGTYKGTLSPSVFVKIESLISLFGLLSCPPREAHRILDAPYNVITVTRADQKLEIDTHDAADERIWALAIIINQISTQIEWQKLED